MTASIIDNVLQAGSEVATGVDDWTARYHNALLGVFGTPQTVLVRGEGCYVWDANGNRYLDLLGGIAVNTLGHANPTLNAAIAAQLGTLGHVSNFFASPVQVALAEQILARTGAPQGSRVFFTNSGTEANEAAFKLARRNNSSGNRTRILALTNAFHGRTMGALALTAKAAYREPFAPLPGGVEFVPANDSVALDEAFAVAYGRDIAAVFVEVIQGEGGVRPLDPAYLAQIRDLTKKAGALMIIDEVQTGIGRTGYWLAHHNPQLARDLVPDAVTLAKGLGGGIPIGAMVTYGEQVSSLLQPGQHGTTFGGNPVAAAAALATLLVIERDGILDQVRLTSAWFVDEVERLAADSSNLVSQVRGAGLLIGIGLSQPVAADVVAHAREAGFIVNAVTPDTIRIAPALNITVAQLSPFVTYLRNLSPASFSKKDGPS